MHTAVQVVSLLALLGSGLIGGVFFAFSSFVMRALLRLPAADGLAAMQSINVSVLNPGFLGVFLGTSVLSLASIVLVALGVGSQGGVFQIAGGVLYLAGTFLVTGTRNVPLNEALARVAPIDDGAAGSWRRYAERWTRWNHFRTAAALLAALCFGVGLTQTA